MKKALENAVETQNLPLIRSLLIDLVTKHTLNTSAIETITEVMEKTPGLFEGVQAYLPDTGEIETLTESLIDSLKSRFTLQAFQLLVESKINCPCDIGSEA